MDSLEKLDPAHAAFSALDSIWKRILAFFVLIGIGHFVGLNIFHAPAFVRDLFRSGLGAFGSFELGDLVWLPLICIGVMFVSFNHVLTFLYVATLAFAFLATIRADTFPRWVFAVIVVGQPIDTFLLEYYDDHPTGLEFWISAALLVIYVAMAAGGCYWWWRLREDHEEWVAPPPSPPARPPPAWPEEKDMHEE